MSKPHLEIFPSEYHMLKFFGKYLPKLDVEVSGRLGPYLYQYDGKLTMGRNLHEFLTQMEKMTALGINTHASVQKGRSYLVFFDDTPKTPEKFKQSVGEIKAIREAQIDEPKEKTISEPLVQTTVIEDADEVKEESELVKKESSRTEEEKTEILNHAESLRDDSKKSAAKAALEEYALTLGISLSKAKTFDNMLEDLKSEL